MGTVLYCFAVNEEARFVVAPAEELLITGMGPRNAERSFLPVLHRLQPRRVFSCGFAGGLNPALARGTVVFSSQDDPPWFDRLRAAGAQPATFHTSDRVAITAAEKKRLFLSTGADAVEMESGVIARLCRLHRIPCLILRVISDAALEDLPLDFNRMMSADFRLRYGKLGLSLARSPAKIGALLRLRRQTMAAAQSLGLVLERIRTGQGMACPQ